MQLSLDHIHLRSPDPDATARFYVERLGGLQTGRLAEDAQLRVTVEMGGLSLFIDRVPPGTTESPDPPHLGVEHLGFRVADIDSAVEALRAHGVPITVAPYDVRPGLRIAFLRGPENVSIELLQRD